MKTIKISKGIQDALVDDDDFDLLSMHNWFFDQSQIYTKLSFPSGKIVGSKTFNLKVRMDYFIFNYSPHINARILHRDGNPYNCQRRNLEVMIKDKGTAHHHRTLYLGVVETPANLKRIYGETDTFLMVGDETYSGKKTNVIDGGHNSMRLALKYDEYARRKHGNDARTNFLMVPLPHRKDQ